MTKVLFLILISFSIHAQKVYTLAECIEIAFRQNPDIQLQNLNILKSSEVYRFSKFNKLPSLSGSVSQGVNGGRSIDPFTNTFVQRSISTNAFGVSTNWNALNGVNKQIEQNRLNLEVEKQQLDLRKKELKVAVIEAFMQVLLAQEFSKLATEQRLDLESQWIGLKEKAKEGLIPNSQISDFEAQIGNVKFEEFNANNNFSVSKLTLSQWLGFSAKTDFNIKQENVFFSDTKAQIVFHPSQRIFDTQLKIAKIATKLAEAAKYPSINISAGLGSAFSSAASAEFAYFKQLNFNLNQYFRIGLNIPIYSNGQVQAKIFNANIQERIIKKQIDQQNLKLNQALEKQKMELELLKEKLSYAEINQNTQSKAYLAAKERFSEGILNITELNTFRLNAEKAKITQIQTQLELNYKTLTLEAFLE